MTRLISAFCLLLFPSIASSAMLILSACGNPVIFLYDDNDRTYVVPVVHLQEQQIEVITEYYLNEDYQEVPIEAFSEDVTCLPII